MPFDAAGALVVSSPEVWGGIECTVNRVGAQYFNQLAWSGHDRRIDDLDAIAALGIRRLRYPVLWELNAPDEDAEPNWSWADERLARLRELEIDPIVGFVHHGSGPAYTNLLDPDFPEKLARYAAQFARRFPWVERYTPVNEPLTTARFSALYGHWYPHATDERSFVRALVNQCNGIAAAMRAVRAVNPAAQLIQTDDLGTVASTPLLRYQADFENERRWLTWDLLCGRVDRGHPLHEHLTAHGAGDRDLAALAERPCAPSIIGINHYLTSDRFLHEDAERFPEHCRGGNGRHRYADVEAVRISTCRLRVAELLCDAWDRYRIPVAVTEAHLGCTREEQLRWLDEIWSAAGECRSTGRDVCAVTVWALLGSFNWNSLVTADGGYYEPGAFDVRDGRLRPTALARATRALAAGRAEPEPVLDAPGWWRRPERFLDAPPAAETRATRGRPLLICGATGTLGRAFARLCERRGLPFRACTRAELDICTDASISSVLDELRPWAVINAAGYVRVDDAESDGERCYRENATGPERLADACAARGIPLLTFSSDLVFDGARTSPYRETDAVAPLNVYGKSKAAAEQAVLRVHPQAIVVRTSAFFGPWDRYNFVTQALEALESGRDFAAIDDLFVSPTYIPDLVDASLDLVIDREPGLWHVANRGSVSWAELAQLAAQIARVPIRKLSSAGWQAMRLAAQRPRYSVLTSDRGLQLPALDDALARFAAARGT